MKEILITSSVLILVILLLRLVLRKRVNRQLIYAAWLLVALRLLIPFQFGQADFSVVAVVEDLEQHSPVIQQAEEVFRQPAEGISQEEVYNQLVQDYLTHPATSATEITPEVQEQLRQQAVEKTTEPTDFSKVLNMVWISGMVLIAGWFLITNLVFLGKIRKHSEPYPQSNCKVPVRISGKISTPCLTGLFRPVIYLTPDSIADPQSLNHVLTHEMTHYRQGDHIWAWVRCLCLCIYWFDPLVWVAAIISKRDCELACDEAALKKLGEDQRIPYGKTLLSIVTHNSVRIFHTSTAMSESRKQLKERVNFIVKKSKHWKVAAICLVLVAAITTGLVFIGCAPQSGTTPPTTNLEDPTANATQPEETEPATTPPEQTEPTTTAPSQVDEVLIPEPHSLFPPATPMVQPESPTEAELIAKEVILGEYFTYIVYGVCCDFGPNLGYVDMSQYLTEEQKEDYWDYQIPLTCCKTAEEVQAHIDRYVGKDAQLLAELGYPKDKLFTDDEGQLYLIVTPTEHDGRWHFEVLSQTKDTIVARACWRDEDSCWLSEIYTLKSTDNGYIVANTEIDQEYKCQITTIHDQPDFQLYQYGNTGYGGAIYAKKAGTIYFMEDFYCPAVTQLSEYIWEITTDYGNGYVKRIYFGYSPKYRFGDETYYYAVALGHGKIAYLDGEMNNRSLVVCELFDPTTARTFTDLDFYPENMPVTAGAFNEDDSQLTLTYRNGQGEEVTITLDIEP